MSPSTIVCMSDELFSMEDEHVLTQSPQTSYHPLMQQQRQQLQGSAQGKDMRKKSKDGLVQRSWLSLTSILHWKSSKSVTQKKNMKEMLSQWRRADGSWMTQGERAPGPSWLGVTVGVTHQQSKNMFRSFCRWSHDA